MTEHVIQFRDTAFAHDGQWRLGPLSFVVRSGETLVLLGESGSGKTTVLRLMNALLMPTGGEVVVLGKTTRAWDHVRLRRSAGYMIQNVGLFPHFTVTHNVEIVPQLEGWSKMRRAARSTELLEMVGLPAREFGHRYPHQLSGGQQQRVGVARALAADPPVLLCDEPFGAVDPVTRADLQREFKSLTHSLHKTVVFVTHDVREALRLGDRIALLDRGQLRFIGNPDEFAASTDPAVRAIRDLR